MELTGKTYRVGQEQQVTSSYTKRELVIVTDEQYPAHILIEFPQGKCNDYLDKLSKGQEVKVHINVGGRLWTNKEGVENCFNSIKGWKIEILGSAAPTLAPVAKETIAVLGEETEDLPF